MIARLIAVLDGPNSGVAAGLPAARTENQRIASLENAGANPSAVKEFGAARFSFDPKPEAPVFA